MDLLENAFAEAQLESGVNPILVAARHPTAMVCPVIVADSRRLPPTRSPRWSQEELRFLDDNLGRLTIEEIAAALGRSVNAVKIKYTRIGLQAPSKRQLTGHQAAKMLGVDIHNIMALVERGILPMERVPGKRGIMAIPKTRLYQWAVNPLHWVYFKSSIDNLDRIGDPHLRRLIIRQKQQWGDEWLSTGQVADLRGVHHTDVNRLIHQGKIKAVRWNNWWVRRSEATRPDLIFYKGIGSSPSPTTWTERADIFLIKARLEWGLTWADIGRMMKKNGQAALGHFHYIRSTGRLAELIQKHGLGGRAHIT